MQTRDRLEDLIGAVVADPARHTRWLNTFSYLEYIGFRKIVKSQRAEILTAAILGHACEEGRHALGLKKLAVKLGGAEFDSYAPEAVLCGEEAEAYFQNLDTACDEAFAGRSEAEREKLTYCYVTWLVERRALDVYQIYKRALGGVGNREKARRPACRGDQAPRDVEAVLYAGDPEFSTRSKEFQAVEAALYQKFIGALSRELARIATIAAPVSA